MPWIQVFTPDEACAVVMRTFADITVVTKVGSANATDLAELPRRASTLFARGLATSRRGLLFASRSMLVVAFFLLQDAAPVLAGDDASTPRIELPEASDQEVIEALKLGYNLPALSQAVTKEERLRTVKTECRRLIEIMRSLGYLDAEVNVSYEVANTMPSAKCASTFLDRHTSWGKTKIIPILGSLYRIGIVEVDGIDNNKLQQNTIADLSNLLLRFTGSVARADTLSNLENEILFRVRAASRPAARVASRGISSDAEARLAIVHLSLEVGLPLQFGAVTFRQLRRQDPQSLAQYVPFLPGDPYDNGQLSALKQKLEQTGLFSSVRIASGEPSKKTGLVPIIVTAHEKAPSVDELWVSGFNGSIVIAIALALLGFRQLVIESGLSRRYRIGVGALAGMASLAAAAFATLRILGFLGAG